MNNNGSVVYFMKSQATGLIKIGRTCSLGSRLNSIKQASGSEVDLLGSFAGGNREEKVVHGMFSHLRVIGEWFRPDQELTDYIRSHSDSVDDLGKKRVVVYLKKETVDRIRKTENFRHGTLSEVVNEALRRHFNKSDRLERWKTRRLTPAAESSI